MGQPFVIETLIETATAKRAANWLNSRTNQAQGEVLIGRPRAGVAIGEAAALRTPLLTS